MQQTTPETTCQTEPTFDPKRRYQCRHVFTEGHRCGSPSLRGENLCYYHHASRRQASLAGRNGYFLMPRIDDRPAIQIALYDVLSRLSQFDIDPKRAGMLLYGLQIASSNFAKHERSAANTEPVVEEIIPDLFLGDLAPITEMPNRPAAESGTPGSTAASSTLGLPPTKFVPQPPTEVVNKPPTDAAPTEAIILCGAKNPRLKPAAPQPSKESGALPAEMRTPGNHPPATLPPLHTVPSPQPIPLAAAAYQTARTCRKLKARTSNLNPRPSNLRRHPHLTRPCLTPYNKQ